MYKEDKITAADIRREGELIDENNQTLDRELSTQELTWLTRGEGENKVIYTAAPYYVDKLSGRISKKAETPDRELDDSSTITIVRIQAMKEPTPTDERGLPVREPYMMFNVVSEDDLSPQAMEVLNKTLAQRRPGRMGIEIRGHRKRLAF